MRAMMESMQKIVPGPMSSLNPLKSVGEDPADPTSPDWVFSLVSWKDVDHLIGM
jgi:hypothetical protein